MQQLITWRWNSPNPAFTAIRRLVENGYLHQEYIAQVAASAIAAPRLFTITRLGAAVLINTYGYDENQLNFLTPQLKNWKTAQTIISTNNFRVALYKALREKPEYELVEWRSESVFRGKPIYVYARENDKTKRKPLYPDSCFILKKGNLTSNNFLEADNGTETYAQFRTQLEVYQAYMASGLHEELFENPRSLNILIVTTTQTRCTQLMKLTAQVGGGKRYRFTTYSKATPDAILSQPIWERIGDEQPIPLML
jgi:hypothetical protein